MHKNVRLLLSIALAACAPLAAGCASTQYKAALDESENENRALREDRAGLKGEVRDLRSQNEGLETALAEANALLLAEPERAPGQSYPELDQVGVGYGTRDGRTVLSIPTEITFAPGKAELSAQGKAALKAVAATLLREHAGAEYWIEGHTDSDPIVKSKYASNRDLSLARAMAVLRSLVDDAGMEDSSCVVAGWGPHRPVAANDTKSNKAKNRRVEIVVEPRK